MLKVILARPASRDRKVLLDRLDHKVQRERPEHKVLKVTPAQPALRERKVLLARLDPKV